MRNLIRRVVGGYKSLKLVGEDQGFVFFQGQDPDTKQPVAIKILPHLLGKDPQPAHMKDYVNTIDDNGGVHINSGIPNRAFYVTAVEIGGYAWEKAGRIWYNTLTDKLGERSTFQDAANMTFETAGELFGAGSLEQQAVRAGWSEVGIAAGTEPNGDGDGCLAGAGRERAQTALALQLEHALVQRARQAHPAEDLHELRLVQAGVQLRVDLPVLVQHLQPGDREIDNLVFRHRR